jgi:hypothetical protein
MRKVKLKGKGGDGRVPWIERKRKSSEDCSRT